MDLENQSLEEKRCNSCGETWPNDSDFFTITRGKVSTVCRACLESYPSRLRRTAQGRQILEDQISQRVAASCHPATFVLMRDYAKQQGLNT